MPPSLHATLLRSTWLTLPQPLRAVHERRPARLVGTATVERGHGWIARLGGRLARLPAAAADAPLLVRLSSVPSTAGPRESWERHFGRSRAMTSQLQMRRGLLVERLGAVTLAFALEAEGACLHWRARAVQLFGVPMPASWLRGVEAREFAEAGQYGFDVRVSLPGIGLVVHYRGRLALAAPEPQPA